VVGDDGGHDVAHGRPWVLRVAGFALIGWGLAIVVW
jgi:hypothetical protein